MANNVPKGNSLRRDGGFVQQLSIFDLMFPSIDGLTTEQVSSYVGLAETALQRKCPVKEFLEIKSFILLHKGRNQWRLVNTQI